MPSPTTLAPPSSRLRERRTTSSLSLPSSSRPPRVSWLGPTSRETSRWREGGRFFTAPKITKFSNPPPKKHYLSPSSSSSHSLSPPESSDGHSQGHFSGHWHLHGGLHCHGLDGGPCRHPQCSWNSYGAVWCQHERDSRWSGFLQQRSVQLRAELSNLRHGLYQCFLSLWRPLPGSADPSVRVCTFVQHFVQLWPAQLFSGACMFELSSLVEGLSLECVFTLVHLSGISHA